MVGSHSLHQRRTTPVEKWRRITRQVGPRLKGSFHTECQGRACECWHILRAPKEVRKLAGEAIGHKLSRQRESLMLWQECLRKPRKIRELLKLMQLNQRRTQNHRIQRQKCKKQPDLSQTIKPGSGHLSQCVYMFARSEIM